MRNYKKINEELIRIFNNVNINLNVNDIIYLNNMDSVKFEIELDNFNKLFSLSENIMKSSLFTYFSEIIIAIGKDIIISEEVKKLFVYDNVKDFYFVDIGKTNIENIKKLKNLISMWKMNNFKLK